MLGRFTSTDPVSGSASSPQSWNRYSYVKGNPLTLLDPTGELWMHSTSQPGQWIWTDVCPKDATCHTALAVAEASKKVTVYGSKGPTDITTYGPNEHGYIDISRLSKHHDPDS